MVAVKNFEIVATWLSRDPNLMLKSAREYYWDYLNKTYKHLINYCDKQDLIPEIDVIHLDTEIKNNPSEIEDNLKYLLSVISHSDAEVERLIFDLNFTIKTYRRFMLNFNKTFTKKEPARTKNGQLSLVM